MRTSTILVLLLLSAVIFLFALQSGKQIVRVGPDYKMPFSPAVKSGQFVFVSGSLATDDQGKIIPGDVRVQTKRILDGFSPLLKAAGSSFENVASVNVYLRNASDFQAMNEVYRTYWPKEPPVRTTVRANLVLPEALVEISLVALSNGAERKVVHPAGWMNSPNPYSYGIISGDTLFVSGIVPRNGKDNSLVEGDIKNQTKAVLDNAGEILKAAGMTYGEVVSSRVFITDTNLFQDMNAAYRSYFPNDPPARATVKAGLMASQYLVEINMIAVKGAARVAITTPNADGSPGQPNPNLSSAVRVGTRLYLSGTLGNNETNKTDIKAQTRETLIRLGRTLRAAGFDWTHVVDGIVYITDVKNFGAMNEAYREVFTGDFPARATVETGLVSPDGLVEIMFTAIKP